jgi:hypothetical protein
VSPRTAEAIRKVCAYGLATLISVLTFRVFGRLAGGLQTAGDPELWALLGLCGLAVLWVVAAKRVRRAERERESV